MVFLHVSKPRGLPLPARKNPQTLRLIAANLSYQNGKAGEVSDILIRTDFDLAVLTEWTGKNALRDRLQKAGYVIALDYPMEGTHGLCVLAKTDLKIESDMVPTPIMSLCRMPFAVSRFLFHGVYITFIGAHTPPPVSACHDANRPTLKAMAAWIENGRLKSDLGPGRKGDPVLIAGDLNEYHPSRSLARFSTVGMTDAFQCGWKPQPTWAPMGVPSLIKIDHILMGKGFTATGAYVIDMNGSDHRSVVADLEER